MSGVIIDIGCGDGKFAYSLAKENPDRFIIGIDPSQKSLEDTSAKIYKKPPKGGLQNALFVLTDIENLPEELNGLANQIFINFPWSGLLKGIILAEDKTWDNIKRICQPGAYIDIIFGYNKDYEKKKIESLELPELNISYITNVMKQKLKEKGFEVLKIDNLTNNDLENYPSSWAKKLKFGKDRNYYYLRLKRF